MIPYFITCHSLNWDLNIIEDNRRRDVNRCWYTVDIRYVISAPGETRRSHTYTTVLSDVSPGDEWWARRPIGKPSLLTRTRTAASGSRVASTEPAVPSRVHTVKCLKLTSHARPTWPRTEPRFWLAMRASQDLRERTLYLKQERKVEQYKPKHCSRKSIQLRESATTPRGTSHH